MSYVEAPTPLPRPTPLPWVFLAGGITDCPDWQSAIMATFRQMDTPAVFLNPRRAGFPIHDPSAADAQVRWEYEALHRADIVLYWFAGGPSVQPIALYELGFHLALQKGDSDRRLVIGCDPGYLRRQDVQIQVQLAEPRWPVLGSLADVAETVNNLVKECS